jgi:hypothetical protein
MSQLRSDARFFGQTHKVRDIHAQSDVVSEGFLSVVARHTVTRYPTIFATVTSLPILDDEGFPSIKRRDVSADTSLQIVRMHAFSPAIPISFPIERAVKSRQPSLKKSRHPARSSMTFVRS